MWSKDKLKALAAERGETADETIGKVLLAHERKKGRTEEDYPRDVASKHLDVLLDAQVGPLPQASAQEYGGLKQLRAYAADRALYQAVNQSTVKEKEPAKSFLQRQVERVYQAREPERERG